MLETETEVRLVEAMCGLQKPICVILLVTNRRHRLLDEEDEDASVDHPKNSRSYGNSRITWNIRCKTQKWL
ncbi:hypothetical protein PGTUg99_009038 [Puccinia graminis f. sp. tritici]|uniref:Uncharacterized protein n=1 Tax=Puccinia graminis f. sp. tritici TaxID=56615 RepID=A0A5B0SJF2_PUCGR|nr:hypothetical protein PGTUg99_009038 [Puccinia graminis f. sp. tritici]